MKTKINKVVSNNIRWLAMWQAYMDFMEQHKRRPSKYYSEDKALYNWCKHSRKLMNNGLMPKDRQRLFNILMETASDYRRLNQYSYAGGVDVNNVNSRLVVECKEPSNEMPSKAVRVSHLYEDNIKVVAPSLFSNEE